MAEFFFSCSEKRETVRAKKKHELSGSTAAAKKGSGTGKVAKTQGRSRKGGDAPSDDSEVDDNNEPGTLKTPVMNRYQPHLSTNKTATKRKATSGGLVCSEPELNPMSPSTARLEKYMSSCLIRLQNDIKHDVKLVSHKADKTQVLQENCEKMQKWLVETVTGMHNMMKATLRDPAGFELPQMNFVILPEPKLTAVVDPASLSVKLPLRNSADLEHAVQELTTNSDMEKNLGCVIVQAVKHLLPQPLCKGRPDNTARAIVKVLFSDEFLAKFTRRGTSPSMAKVYRMIAKSEEEYQDMLRFSLDKKDPDGKINSLIMSTF